MYLVSYTVPANLSLSKAADKSEIMLSLNYLAVMRDLSENNRKAISALNEMVPYVCYMYNVEFRDLKKFV